jgi:hypothetical protein
MRHISMKLRWLSVLIVLGLVFQFIGPAAATGVVIDTSQNQQATVIRGEFEHGTFGEVSIMGDFNGDGFDDLLIGAPASNANDNKFAGAAYVILGRQNMPSEINLAATDANLTIYGANPGDILGHSVAVGDVNGDGIDDIIVGADRVDHPNQENMINVGAVYVFLGRDDGNFFNQNPKGPSDADVVIYGEFNDGRFGRAVTAGDVTGNTIDDLVIGAYFASPGGRNRTGALYVIQGNNVWTPGQDIVTVDLSQPDQQAHLTIYGQHGGAGISALAADEVKNIHPLIEEEFYITQAGIGDRLGRSVAVGNVNGTGQLDIVAGAYGADVGTLTDAGKTYVFYDISKHNPGKIINLGNGDQADVTINGIAGNDQAGFYVAAGNINNDTYAEIMIGAHPANANTGQVYLVYGSGNLPSTINLGTPSGVNVVTIHAENVGDRLGRSLTFADISGDGRDDLLIGASWADPNGRVMAGKAYVIFTDQALPSVINLGQDGAANIRILGAASGTFEGEGRCVASIEDENLEGNCPDELGRAVAAGDFNNDGRNEVVVGALFSNNGELLNAGAVYIISGAQVQGTKIFLPIINR